MNTTSSHSASQADGFLELARLSWGSTPSPTSETNVQSTTDLITLLADLLRAASSGVGGLKIPAIMATRKGDRTFLFELAKYPQFFAVDGDIICLPRYATNAADIHAFFERRLLDQTTALGDAAILTALNALLPHKQERHPDGSGKVVFDNLQQRLAIAALVDARVGILTGGPGTGKTTTAAALLAVLKRLDPGLSPESILVAAPTGKAACRMGEAIGKAAGHLCSLSPAERDFLNSIRALTLHKALEWSPIPPERGGPFRRGPERPLNASLVLVDEASMIDTNLMHALTRAMPASGSLLLLGDSDQLESVEVGGVFSQLISRASVSALAQGKISQLSTRLGISEDSVHTAIRVSSPQVTASTTRPPLSGLMFSLKDSRRAMHAPWILELADCFRLSSEVPFRRFKSLIEGSAQGIRWFENQIRKHRAQECESQWNDWAQAAQAWHGLDHDSPSERLTEPLARLNSFQLLCSTNRQVDRANEDGVALLQKGRKQLHEGLPHGCPIIIETNSHSLGLSNGDVGIVVAKNFGEPATLALFPAPNGAPRLIPIPQLPAHRQAFALTIHKSQGSEWRHVAIELPDDADSSLISKNLLYTAITRASSEVTIFGSATVLQSLLG